MARGEEETAPKAPSTLGSPTLVDDLPLLGSPGCIRGKIVFQVPKRRTANGLGFALDYTRSDPDGNTQTTQVRFAWRLPR